MSKKVIYIKENTLGSMLSDFFTFVAIVGSFWFNYKFIDGNNALDALLFICFFMFSVGKAAQIKKVAEIEKQETSQPKDSL